MSESEYDIASDLWLRQNRPREALEHALDAVELNEDNAEAHHLVALVYLDFCGRNADECRLSDAELHARRALELREDFREAKNTLGVILIHDKRWSDAVGVLEPLTRDMLYQTPENAWGNLGWAYLELGKLDQAVDALRRSVAAEPRFCVGSYRLGLALEKKGQPSQAAVALTQALETPEPACKNLQLAWAARARVRFQLGRMEEARSDLEQCVSLDKESRAGKECRSMLQKLK
jgi:Tfp pilus assembly protein PilF